VQPNLNTTNNPELKDQLSPVSSTNG